MDRRSSSPAGRVVLPLAVLLGLVWSGSSALPRTAAAPPAQAAVAAVAAMAAPGGVLAGQSHLVVTAGRHAQRNRRPSSSLAMLAAAAAIVVAAARLWSWPAGARRPNRRLPAVRPRAPPSGP